MKAQKMVIHVYQSGHNLWRWELLDGLPTNNGVSAKLASGFEENYHHAVKAATEQALRFNAEDAEGRE